MSKMIGSSLVREHYKCSCQQQLLCAVVNTFLLLLLLQLGYFELVNTGSPSAKMSR
ncbi:hypothetical protein Sjap_010317 [Stephania japonica]|uniref:Uncharacterized protein n=1 Tax=Stephania japonica TaxID=461633 RepID=A0AAP0JA54_9MAGN